MCKIVYRSEPGKRVKVVVQKCLEHGRKPRKRLRAALVAAIAGLLCCTGPAGPAGVTGPSGSNGKNSINNSCADGTETVTNNGIYEGSTFAYVTKIVTKSGHSITTTNGQIVSEIWYNSNCQQIKCIGYSGGIGYDTIFYTYN